MDPAQTLLELETLQEPTDKQQIRFVNEAVQEDFAHNTDNYLALFSGAFGNRVVIPRFAVGAQVDAEGTVGQMVNPSENGQVPLWEKTPLPLDIPAGGYVVLAFDTSYQKNNFKRFLATRLRPGGQVRLLAEGKEASVQEVAGNTVRPILHLQGKPVFSTTEEKVTLGGKVIPFDPQHPLTLQFEGANLPLEPDGSFVTEVSLKPGLNNPGFTLLRASGNVTRSQLIRQVVPAAPSFQPVVLWMEQYTSMGLRNTEDIRQFLVRAKHSGINGIAIDVKGYEGFVSYLKNDLTGRPHISTMQGPARQGSNPQLDLLGEMVRQGHLLGLNVYASINTFGEGSMRESALIGSYPRWEEQVYHWADGGQILPVRQSKAPGRVVLFVNPVDPDVRDMELRTIEEIVKNYPVDGLILDRTRFDGGFADFSPTSREAFERYLQPLGKHLTRWPDDVYRWTWDQNGNPVQQEGPLFLDWWTFRARVIGSFVQEARKVMDRYRTPDRELQLGQYVGGVYDNLYEFGINWASPDFQYDPRLQLVNARIYTPEYLQTGYLNSLDFVMLGTYQNDPFSVVQDLTIAAVVSQDKKPLLGGVGLQGASDPEVLRELLQVHRTYSSGMMLFEYSTANLDTIRAGLENQQYTTQMWVGVSTPTGKPLMVDAVDVPRANNQLVLYTARFGASTQTARYGVEVTIGPDGVVTEGKNLEQARNWNFNNPQDNNSLIPVRGLVLSAMDASGSKVKRQGLALALKPGDPVRVARLKLEGAKNGSTVEKEHVLLQGQMEVLGTGAASLSINGQPVLLRNGKFVQVVPLEVGSNTIRIHAEVDGQVTLERTLQVTRTED
ncbi:hypothetical protein GCM10008938_50820 [Deinococcus roseus]|uniref:Glycosyl hydrolase-like 10 domain-containing protein n=2 Tax=Deinococcus roseus TaxID=392414 RepID=A0ABQ2DHR4_9DEIO|nr:hypothetical protein GCM10008938_50820 [Deinococcus roseus]